MSLEYPGVPGGSKYPWYILVSLVDLSVPGGSNVPGELPRVTAKIDGAMHARGPETQERVASGR